MPAINRPLDITVLMGGPSSEREVSLVSGAAVADALDRIGHAVTRADISPDDVSSLDRPGIDLVFIAMHGVFGESGEVQQLCEQRGLCYVGSGPRASELALDKAVAKQLFRQAGLITPDWVVAEASQDAALVARQVAELSLPVVLKPIDGGSSVDVTIARDAAVRDEAIKALLAKYGRAIIERFVRGRELTVGVLGEAALPVLEIVTAEQFYTYHAKYADDAGTLYVFDHGLNDDVCHSVQQAALKAHRCLGCRDMSRVDFILDASGTLQLLEINTIPGFTSHSLLPMAAQHTGLSFDALLAKLVELAMARHEDKVCRQNQTRTKKTVSPRD